MDRRLPALGVWPVRDYQGVKMSWVELDRIVSEEILRDDGIRRRVAESGRPLLVAGEFAGEHRRHREDVKFQPAAGERGLGPRAGSGADTVPADPG